VGTKKENSVPGKKKKSYRKIGLLKVLLKEDFPLYRREN